MEMTVDYLKLAGSRIVAGFRTTGTSLTDGIIKEAEVSQLNSDQIARLTETVNQLAYLSGPHMGMDKTAEFPVAKYEDVIKHFVTPTMEKAASTKGSPMDIFSEPLEKKAFVEPPKDTQDHALRQEFDHVKRELENLQLDAIGHFEGIRKEASLLAKDPDALNKIAAFADGDSKKSEELCKVVFGHVKEAKASTRSQGQLMSIKALSDKIGLAKVAEERREYLEKRASKIADLLEERTGINKAAFLGAIGAAFRSPVGATSGKKTISKGLKLGGTAVMAGPEISQIAANSVPKADVWGSLHN